MHTYIYEYRIKLVLYFTKSIHVFHFRLKICLSYLFSELSNNFAYINVLV